METTTPFDLNHAIQQWRNDLAQSSAFRGENLDELETHLRDSVVALQARDLSAEEAFYVAARRVGTGAVLIKEFGKVNAVNVWVERCLWALIVMQLWNVISHAGIVLVTFLAQGTNVFNRGGGMASLYELTTIVAVAVAPTLITVFVMWKLFKSPDSGIGVLLNWLSGQPVVLAASLFLMNAAMGWVNLAEQAHFIKKYAPQSHSPFPLVAYYQIFLPHLLVAGLVFVIARKRLLRKA
ncbi:MAG TPA: hypothetical protein VK742_03460 [Candidatus Sulfotelmatobacter sp.]|jgi:hypothetical protein|nr:hypothetical protein [Candidatus Sulfotelmatobacter sp.]